MVFDVGLDDSFKSKIQGCQMRYHTVCVHIFNCYNYVINAAKAWKNRNRQYVRSTAALMRLMAKNKKCSWWIIMVVTKKNKLTACMVQCGPTDYMWSTHRCKKSSTNACDETVLLLFYLKRSIRCAVSRWYEWLSSFYQLGICVKIIG